jgi:hypothetical protein
MTLAIACRTSVPSTRTAESPLAVILRLRRSIAASFPHPPFDLVPIPRMTYVIFIQYHFPRFRNT